MLLVILFGIIILIFLLYSVVPNVLTRIFHVLCIRTGPRRNEVALTFDDGPDPLYTPQVLDVLKKHDVKATFFVLADKAVREPELIERMVRDGHDIQIHGMTHKFVPALGIQTTIRQIQGASQMLQKECGIETSYYRPTWGLCNLASLFCLAKSGHRLITWSVMVGDWRVTSAETLLHRIIKKLEPGAVIVLHDSDVTPGAEKGAPLEVIRLLPLLAAAIHEKGYEFKKVSEWL